MRYICKNNKLRIVAMILLSTIILLVGITTYAEQLYTKSTELGCDNMKVQVVTKCMDNSSLHFPFCIDQKFIFIEQKTG